MPGNVLLDLRGEGRDQLTQFEHLFQLGLALLSEGGSFLPLSLKRFAEHLVLLVRLENEQLTSLHSAVQLL